MMKTALTLLGSAMLLCGSAGATPIQWSENGHWYDFVYVEPVLTWETARDLATASGGYLVTLTTVEENQFVWEALLSRDTDRFAAYWLGGYQPGPAAGEGDPAAGWAWVSGEAWGYTNWYPGEPNDGMGGTQDYLHFWPQSGAWDDMENGRYMAGYVLEYGRSPDSAPVPEPTTVVLLGTGLLGLACYARRREVL
jgi:hypothetical protein